MTYYEQQHTNVLKMRFIKVSAYLLKVSDLNEEFIARCARVFYRLDDMLSPQNGVYFVVLLTSEGIKAF